MVYNYKITNSAYDDIDKALDYIANKLLNISSAKKLITVLRLLYETQDIENILKNIDIDLQ